MKKTFKQIETCTRCNGKGYLGQYLHRQEGVCYECGGSGKVEVEYELNKNFGLVEEIPSYTEYMTTEEKEAYENAEIENEIVQVSMKIYTKYENGLKRVKQIEQYNKTNEKQYKIKKVRKI